MEILSFVFDVFFVNNDNDNDDDDGDGDGNANGNGSDNNSNSNPCIQQLRPQYERQSKIRCPTKTTR